MDCRKCNGCGRVADTDEQEPWTQWTSLPLQSSVAVLMGIVKPITCPDCNGTGLDLTSSHDPSGYCHILELMLRNKFKVHRHTDQCLEYAARTGKAFCIAECADSRDEYTRR